MDPQNTYSVLAKGDPTAPTSTSPYDQRPQILKPQAIEFLDRCRNPIVRKQVTHLLNLQAQKRREEEVYQLELLKLEKKYLAGYKPLYEERATVISGADLSCDLHAIVEGFNGPPAAIPEFWLTAMQNHPSLRDLIQDWDCEVLSYLTDIRVQPLLAPELGFRLDFVFAPNPYIENETLTKTYMYERVEDGGLFYGEMIGSEISWKKGAEVPTGMMLWRTSKMMRELLLQYSGSSKASDDPPPESFFDFFDSEPVPKGYRGDLEILEMKLALNYGYGEIFKDTLIPNAVDWFIGEV
ncbi:nucleosome assembly protein [Acephala macrosclerotiorum]|nr:nucleosome assembly protein [Acephala macrosclerotiorum]